MEAAGTEDNTLTQGSPASPSNSTSGNQPNDLLFEAVRKVVTSEVISELAWRLPLLSLTLAATAIGSAILDGAVTRLFAGYWLAVAGFYLISFGLFLQKNLRNVYLFASCSAVAAILWWVGLPLFNIGSGRFAQMIFVLLVLSIAGVPWPKRTNITLFAIYIAVALSSSFRWPSSSLFLVITLLVSILGLRISALSFLGLMCRATLPILVKACESFSSVMTSVRLLAWNMCLVADTHRALILVGQSKCELMGDGRLIESNVDQVFLLGLRQRLESNHENEAMISFDQFGEQFLPAFTDWFGSKPRAVFFAKFAAVLDNREERITIILPCMMGTRLAGAARVARALSVMSSVIRLSLGATRSRFISSDVLRATERAVSEKDQDVNQLIHLVNNVAQEISIGCDSCRELLSESASATAEKARIIGEIEGIEAAARVLSAGVSDLKWLKELSRTRVVGRVEKVELATVVEELHSYAKYRALRRGEKFYLENLVSDELALLVPSREFLEASLRLLLRLSEYRIKESKGIKLQILSEAGNVVFRFWDQGESLSRTKQQLLLAGEGDYANLEREEHLIKAVVNLAKLSKGSASFGSAEPDFSNCFELKLPSAEIQKATQKRKDAWILLVDDKVQITSFYARVAEALQLTYETADSVDRAEELVKSNGCPLLVITDIQLGESSGLDLVRSLRRQFGNAVPIIVVSGNTEPGIAEAVHSSGATKYLTKPVGRGKLFAEINAILSQK